MLGKSGKKAARPRSSDHTGVGPELTFAAATLAVVSAWGALKMTAPPDLILPVVTSLVLLFASAIAIVAWRHRTMDQEAVTYWDVAGALTLIGLCLSATIEPDQLLRLVQDGSDKH